ncbi:MAG: S8 family peptidase [Lachnospiraceae bacterium]
MNDQKLEDLLNLALDVTEEELERSEELRVGYDPVEKTWQLIVRHSGPAEALAGPEISVYQLLGGYAIVTIPESMIEEFSARPEVEYIEKPKRLFFALNQAKAASCINSVQTDRFNLTGNGILVGVIDSGIDYFHQDFRNEDGSTRILKLWDQVLDRVFTEEEINQALDTGSRSGAREKVPSVDGSGHGTAVAGIAAGNGREDGGRYRGVAFQSRLLIVKLGVPDPDGFPKTTELMKAVDFVVRQAAEYGQPVAVNISFGNTYGSHDGTSLLETFLDMAAIYGRTVICVGTGNEASRSGHTSGIIEQGFRQDISLSVASYETGFGVQLWKSYVDEMNISLIAPSGRTVGPIRETQGTQIIDFGDTIILLYYGMPSPYSQAQEIYFDFIPRNQYMESGIWKFQLEGEQIVLGNFDFWLPSGNILNPATRFLFPTPDITLTIPSTAVSVISVGAYNDRYQSYADFSGRGYTRSTRQIKPDLAAPGVEIIAPSAGGGYQPVTGTSFATPFVTGGSALLMEWGIQKGNDPYLYGEKVKAYLIRGARHLPGFETWPNPLLGYGTLCVRDSLPV